MEILAAGKNNIIEVIYLVNNCIEHMIEQGIYENTDNYPNLNSIKKDISNKSLFIAKEKGLVLGIITLDENHIPDYKNIAWTCNDQESLVIHRLAIFPSWEGKGIAKMLIKFSEEYALKNNYSSIRLDIGSNNIRMINIFKSNEYGFRGEIKYSSGLPFFCFEKILTTQLSSV